jgi:hypothetical protein
MCRVLEVVLSEQVSRQGFSALRKLSSLREFLFPLYSQLHYLNGPRRQDLLELSFELLPHLHAAAYNEKTSRAGNALTVLSTLTSRILRRITVPLTLQLRLLALKTLKIVPKHVHLPEVRVLYLDHQNHPNYKADPIAPDRFPNLTELSVYYTDEQTLMSVVGQGAGLKLRSLSIGLNGGMKRLDSLLEACPGLRELYLNVPANLQSASRLRPDTLQKLQELRISCLFLSAEAHQSAGQLMLEILRLAPKLRSVTLSMVPMAEKDLQELAELAIQGTCLRQLESFEFYRKTSDEFTSAEENRIRDEAIVALGTHCERLKDFLFVDNDFSY